MLRFTPNTSGRWIQGLYIGISTVFDLNAFFVPAQETADDLTFGDTAKGNVKPTGRETPAKTKGGGPENAQRVLSGPPPLVSG
jgi:hypothetical protein